MKGDVGDAFYIIVSGSVTIFIDEPTEYKNFMQLVRERCDVSSIEDDLSRKKLGSWKVVARLAR